MTHQAHRHTIVRCLRRVGPLLMAAGLLLGGCEELDQSARPGAAANDSKAKEEAPARPAKQNARKAPEPTPEPEEAPEPEPEEDSDEQQRAEARPEVREQKQDEPRAERQPLKPAVKLPPQARTRRLKRTGESATAGMTIHNAAVASAIEDRKPVGVSSTFRDNVDKLWAYVRIQNDEAPSHVTMVWKRNGKTRSQVKLKVGTSRNWRTWSSKRIAPGDAGNWSVEIVDPAGRVLETMNFKLVASKAG